MSIVSIKYDIKINTKYFTMKSLELFSEIWFLESRPNITQATAQVEIPLK